MPFHSSIMRYIVVSIVHTPSRTGAARQVDTETWHLWHHWTSGGCPSWSLGPYKGSKRAEGKKKKNIFRFLTDRSRKQCSPPKCKRTWHVWSFIWAVHFINDHMFHKHSCVTSSPYLLINVPHNHWSITARWSLKMGHQSVRRRIFFFFSNLQNSHRITQKTFTSVLGYAYKGLFWHWQLHKKSRIHHCRDTGQYTHV